MPQPTQTFSRLSVPDPMVNMVVQDIYNKLSQVQAQLVSIQNDIAALKKKVGP